MVSIRQNRFAQRHPFDPLTHRRPGEKERVWQRSQGRLQSPEVFQGAVGLLFSPG